MILSWASFYEGRSDRFYYDVLIPRIIDEILLNEGLRRIDVPSTPAIELGRRGRAVQEVGQEICADKEAFHLVFIHADAGGRAMEAGIDARSYAYCKEAAALCGWSPERCITLRPRHETEAWMLAEPSAVLKALGYSGTAEELSLPANGREAERLADPKALLQAAYNQVSNSRRSQRSYHYTAIAQNQTLEGLRTCPSFVEFEQSLRRGLQSLGCISARP